MRSTILILAAALALTAPTRFASAEPHAHGAHIPASAVRTSPADGDMGAPPDRFSATFPHAMRLTSLVVTPRGGDPLAVNVARATSGTTVSAALPRLAPGTYVIAWTASGEDNHTMTGRVGYMVH